MRKQYFGFFLLLVLFLQIFSSCRSVKQLTLFQKYPTDPDTIVTPKAYPSSIQTGDILQVYVTSLSSAASTYFNPYQSARNTVQAGGISGVALSSEEAPGYLVDPNGNVELPLVGTIKVGGLSTLQAKDTIKAGLMKYLKEPTVTVRILNYRITLMGEVGRPAVYNIPNERITLPEVISMGGELTVYGRRDNILIIRDNNGKKEFGHVNLNSREVYRSPYYYLRSNDLVYVEPTSGKAIQNNSFFRIFPIVASVVTLAIALFTRVF